MFFFIAIFLIIAPLIIFYASGYRFDLKRYKILRTGTLFIEAKGIKKADLYINNKLYEMPFDEKIFIYNLLPGDFQIKLAREGYHDWQKKTVIQSSLTTFIKDAVLFKDEAPQLKFEGQINNFSISPDQQKLIYISATDSFEEFYYYDLLMGEKKLLYRIPRQDSAPRFFWAPSSKKILLNYEQKYTVIAIENNKNVVSLSSIISLAPLNVRWDLQSDNLLYGQSKNIIYKIDLLTKKTGKYFQLEESQINPEFYLEGNDLFYLEQTENKNILSKYNFSYKTTKKILELSKAEHYKFIKSTNNYLGLIDLDNQKLYLVKKSNTDLEINILDEPVMEFKAKEAWWDDKERQLLFYDDFEIAVYNSKINKEQIINRYGQVIKKVAWYPDLDHIIILSENNIQIIDITQEIGTRNATEIVNIDKLYNFELDKKGETFFLNGQIGKASGLYQLELQ